MRKSDNWESKYFNMQKTVDKLKLQEATLKNMTKFHSKFGNRMVTTRPLNLADI